MGSRTSYVLGYLIAAAEGGQTEIVQYLHKKGAVMTKEVTNTVAGNGNLKLLRWMRDNKAKFDNFITRPAA